MRISSFRISQVYWIQIIGCTCTKLGRFHSNLNWWEHLLLITIQQNEIKQIHQGKMLSTGRMLDNCAIVECRKQQNVRSESGRSEKAFVQVKYTGFHSGTQIGPKSDKSGTFSHLGPTLTPDPLANGNFFLKKKENFWQFFWKICQVFGNFLTFKWQFSGGSGVDQSEAIHLL